MAKRFILALASRVFGFPRTAESLARDLLFVGSLALLILIGAIGYWSKKSFDTVEKEIARIHEREAKHTVLVMKIARTARNFGLEVSAFVGNPEFMAQHFVAGNRVRRLKEEMEDLIKQGRITSLAETDEWGEFEAAFNDFWATINLPVPIDWNIKRDHLGSAVQRLEDLTGEERLENQQRTQVLSRAARNRIVGATVAAVLLGVLVAGLTIYEIRRVLKQVARAYGESARSRDYLQSLLDSLVSGVVVIGKDGAVQTISASFSRLMGVAGGFGDGDDYKRLFSDRPLLVERIGEDLQSETLFNRYYGRVELGEGELFDVFASPLIVAGEERGIILVFVDVTRIEQAQSELRRNRALAAVGQMTAQIAHEIKNPLGSIRFAAEVLKRQPEFNMERDAETVGVIERSVDHLSSIVAELNEFARPKELRRAETHLAQLLDDVIPMVADRLSAKGIRINKSYSTELPAGRYDITELKKLFLNLIINAIDASKAGGAIELHAGLDGGGTAKVDIIDHGSGMDKKTLERLFEPFYTTKQTGTGLGMAIAKKIAELHGGDLSVSSKEGQGTTVTVKLPLE